MQYRKKMMTAVALTLIVTLIVSVSTESLRDYLYFTWQVQEGEHFIFEVSVDGYSETGNVLFPVAQAVLNNTRLMVEIVSLPMDSIIIDGKIYAEYIIEYLKTNLSFENGTAIPLNLIFEMNNLVSRCFVPRGPWNLLDSFYPDNFVQPINATAESYISHFQGNSFYIGYVSYSVNRGTGWNCVCSMSTGVPSTMKTWAWSYGGLHEYSYNVTLNLVG
ncbi:MAG: hypothetical protein OEV85_11845 [Candidatus Thorarchaeota archaeon]|nr:hypothetical protein [Candidatus Thorarchaeota archaeon]